MILSFLGLLPIIPSSPLESAKPASSRIQQSIPTWFPRPSVQDILGFQPDSQGKAMTTAPPDYQAFVSKRSNSWVVNSHLGYMYDSKQSACKFLLRIKHKPQLTTLLQLCIGCVNQGFMPLEALMSMEDMPNAARDPDAPSQSLPLNALTMGRQ
jgi:hypothetical protein